MGPPSSRDPKKDLQLQLFRYLEKQSTSIHNNPISFKMIPPSTPSRSMAVTEPLSPNGDNLAFLSPELATFMGDLRDKVKAARAWPVAGRYAKGYVPTFTPFCRLPSEIRQRIYEIASCQPRVIEVTCQDRPMSDTPVPALLHTSLESRKIAMKIYQPLLLDEVETGTYVNWDLDTLFVNDRRSVYNRSMDYAILHEKCKKLALPCTHFSTFHLPADYKNVESLIVVLKVASGDGNVVFVPADCEEEALSRPKQEVVRLWEEKRIKSYIIRDAIRGQERMITDPGEKIVSRRRREKERKTIAPLLLDEDFAIRLQYDLDHGRL